MILHQFLRSKKKQWRNASDGDGVLFIFSGVEGCAAASSFGNKDGYSVGFDDDDGGGGGVCPLFLLDLGSGNKRWRNTSNCDGVFFSFFWCRSGRCGSDNEAYDDSNVQLGGGDFFVC